VDQLFNSSEKRLARILLLRRSLEKPRRVGGIHSSITQETLAEAGRHYAISREFIHESFSRTRSYQLQRRIQYTRRCSMRSCSIITPTEPREPLLPSVHEVFRADEVSLSGIRAELDNKIIRRSLSVATTETNGCIQD